MPKITISIAAQTLSLEADGQQQTYAISTALNGAGERENSGCTPRGWHMITEKFGADLPENSVFVARQATGEIYTAALANQFPNRDWVLTRILWLSGLEAGFNQGEGCDSHARYIYIHGTPDSEPMGEPRSHGCIRMRNQDVLKLFDQVEVGTIVEIQP
ncbi:MAG: L,D-transpeptidase [Pseudomonadota bacterium]|nr:L,D-transpeptidase [Pseudomonadota bacterium]